MGLWEKTLTGDLQYLLGDKTYRDRIPEHELMFLFYMVPGRDNLRARPWSLHKKILFLQQILSAENNKYLSYTS
jgi:hypothetical protein